MKLLMIKMMTKIREGKVAVLGQEEEGEAKTTELRQIYMVETLQQKIQDVLLKQMMKDFKYFKD